MEKVLEKGGIRARVDLLGAQLVSLSDTGGTEYIWQRDPRFWSNCAPVLFPIVGSLREGRVQIEGETYQMPQHGFASRSLFTSEQQVEDSLTCLLVSSEETLRMYPYRFSLRVCFTLLPDGLSVRYLVKNADSRTMVFGIGGHPGINCPLAEGERFEDYELRFAQPESVLSPTFSERGEIVFSKRRDFLRGADKLRLDYSLFVPDAIILEGLKSREVTLRGTKSGKGIRFAFPDYQTIAFWTPARKNAPFLCFEPWYGMGARDDEPDDTLTGKHGLIHLQPGGEWSAEYAIHFLR